MTRPLRIAVVGLLDSVERPKLTLLRHGIEQAGHTALLVDAEPFAAGRSRVERTKKGLILIDGSIRVDAVWPEALDNGRRLEFEGLYRQLAAQRIPTLAGSWESVLATTFKHRTRATLAAGGLAQPHYAVVRAEQPDEEIERARAALPSPGVWAKAPNSSHGHGVTLIPPGSPAATAARTAMRDTPDGALCLLEEDHLTIIKDLAGTRYRADVAVTVLDGRAIHAVLRVQPALGAPTNSRYGGRSFAVGVGSLPAEVRSLAIAAVTRVAGRYGSADILGGVTDFGPFTVAGSPRPVVAEVNLMPGGRSPGFAERVVGPLVRAYVATAVATSG